ncbi:hypothetical protein AZI86_11805 [Bdellovibrio bacteriovorus]|uniref:Uncharacterized protein n=1 Tax=Bdellovibrio bacteriovorus TaxID=959 RepID=A0A150WLS0_BDEBC|nr:hypothetical protein AZI86_11805 [Bdellovibrio bacteriovorus]
MPVIFECACAHFKFSIYEVMGYFYSKFKIQNSKFKIQNSKFKIQNSKFKTRARCGKINL